MDAQRKTNNCYEKERRGNRSSAFFNFIIGNMMGSEEACHQQGRGGYRWWHGGVEKYRF